MTQDLITRLAGRVEQGKADRDAPYPPDLRGEDGAVEICLRALEDGIPPDRILQGGLVAGMQRVGERFGRGEAFIPEILIAARAMHAAMAHLQPHFETGAIRRRGTIVLGTVAGDLHDIGKNIVRMVLEGDGWNVIDLGVDVAADRFVEAVVGEAADAVGLSALLTTTMVHMPTVLDSIRATSPETAVYIGGAPVTSEFADRIGASGFFPDPFSFARHLSAAT